MSRSLRLDTTPEQQAMIEAKIDEYMAGEAYEGARRACAEAHALPLYLDWSACMAIRPDGEVIWIDDDEPHRIEPVDNERLRNLGLFQGSRRDPDLQCLVPPRPPEAIDCPDCKGTGKVTLPGGHERLAEKVACFSAAWDGCPLPRRVRSDRRRAPRRRSGRGDSCCEG